MFAELNAPLELHDEEASKNLDDNDICQRRPCSRTAD